MWLGVEDKCGWGVRRSLVVGVRRSVVGVWEALRDVAIIGSEIAHNWQWERKVENESEKDLHI